MAYSTSPGIGPIISCCRAGHRGSGVGQPDLNQYFPLPCLFVIATNESSGTSSRLGFACMLLVLVAGDVAVTVLMLFLLDSSRWSPLVFSSEGNRLVETFLAWGCGTCLKESLTLYILASFCPFSWISSTWWWNPGGVRSSIIALVFRATFRS